MTASRAISPALARCCEDYVARKQECDDFGLDPDAIARNAANDMRVSQGRCWVKVRAYKPTGVALGCPLPSREFQQHLLESITVAGTRLKALCGMTRTVAHVPERFFHVTVVNRDHFDHRDDGSVVRCLSPREHRHIEAVIRGLGIRRIRIHFKGWQLTRSGRFMVLGFPRDEALFQLRAALINEVPQLRANPPATAHIKPAHMLAWLDRKQLRSFQDWMSSYSSFIDHALEFTEVYTPLGRIPLSK